jgi:hypothetical protein
MPIMSILLGSTRKFLIRSRTDGIRDQHSVKMTNDSAIFIENSCQHQYLHLVPREMEVLGGRINLTFHCKGDSHWDGGNKNILDGAITKMMTSMTTAATIMTPGEEDPKRSDNRIHNILTGGNACAWKALEDDGRSLDVVHGEDQGVSGDASLFLDLSSDDVDLLTMQYIIRTNVLRVLQVTFITRKLSGRYR